MTIEFIIAFALSGHTMLLESSEIEHIGLALKPPRRSKVLFKERCRVDIVELKVTLEYRVVVVFSKVLFDLHTFGAHQHPEYERPNI